MSQMFETRLRLKDIQNVEISELDINTTIRDVGDKNMPETVWIETMQSIDCDIDNDQHQDVDFDITSMDPDTNDTEICENNNETQIVYSTSIHNESVAKNQNDSLAFMPNLNLKENDSDNDYDSKQASLAPVAPTALLPVTVLESKFVSEGINKMSDNIIHDTAYDQHDNKYNDNYLGLPTDNSQIKNRTRGGTMSTSYTKDGHTRNMHLMAFNTGHTSSDDHDTLNAHGLGARKSVGLEHIIPEWKLNGVSAPISQLDEGDEKSDSTLNADEEHSNSCKLSIGPTKLVNMASTNKELEGVFKKRQDAAEANNHSD